MRALAQLDLFSVRRSLRDARVQSLDRCGETPTDYRSPAGLVRSFESFDGKILNGYQVKSRSRDGDSVRRPQSTRLSRFSPRAKIACIACVMRVSNLVADNFFLPASIQTQPGRVGRRDEVVWRG